VATSNTHMDPESLATLAAEHKQNIETVKDHESRIRFLERWVSMAIGATGLVSFLYTMLKEIHTAIK
jgi:hypothetical protein